MPKKIPIFYSALLLTGVNLLLRLAGTSFQVYLSQRIGAAGIGLLQLVLSVGNLAVVAGMAGVRTAAMYLTAGELGNNRPQNVRWVLSGCFVYSILASSLVAGALYFFAPWVAENWIRQMQTVGALRLFAAFLPVSTLCGVMTGYFTAANRIGTLAVVEIAEQLCSMALTLVSLHFWAGRDPSRACQCVILGSSLGAALTLALLVILRLREHAPRGPRISVRRGLAETAMPLALADIVRSGINTTENLMVPRRLALNPRILSPLAAFGLVSGMVFPVLMFPACILFALAELLIPELARCAAAGSQRRIRYLVRRCLKVAMLYGCVFSGLEFLLADSLCLGLYKNTDGAAYLRLYALLMPMLYCDAITDAMTKGLGQQKICVRYNILTSALDVVFLYFLLPKYGMNGYFVSFFVTHLINFLLSLRRLLMISGEKIPLHIPMLTVAVNLCAMFAAEYMDSLWSRGLAYTALLGSLLVLAGVVKKEDWRWVLGIVRSRAA